MAIRIQFYSRSRRFKFPILHYTFRKQSSYAFTLCSVCFQFHFPLRYVCSLYPIYITPFPNPILRFLFIHTLHFLYPILINKRIQFIYSCMLSGNTLFKSLVRSCICWGRQGLSGIVWDSRDLLIAGLLSRAGTEIIQAGGFSGLGKDDGEGCFAGKGSVKSRLLWSRAHVDGR
jgi:hypothetical protein